MGGVVGPLWVTRMMFLIPIRGVATTHIVGPWMFTQQKYYFVITPMHAVTHNKTHCCGVRPEHTVSACFRRLGRAFGVYSEQCERHDKHPGSALEYIAIVEH